MQLITRLRVRLGAEVQPPEDLRGRSGEDGRQVTEARLELARVRAAMDDLPQEYRTVLMLVCVEGMRYREAAEALELPVGTIMSRLSRARLALAQSLEVAPVETRSKGEAR